MTGHARAHPGFAQGAAAAFAATLLRGGQPPIAKGAFAALAGRARPILLAGTLGLGASALLLFIGLSLTRPEVAVITLALQPAMAAIAEWIVDGRPPPRGCCSPRSPGSAMRSSRREWPAGRRCASPR